MYGQHPLEIDDKPNIHLAIDSKLRGCDVSCP